MSFDTLHATLDTLVSEGTLTRYAVRIGRRENILHECFRGTDENTLFDMASVTKIFATTAVCLQTLGKGLELDTPVSDFFPVPPEKESLTIRHLLTHTNGHGHNRLNYPEVNYDNVAEFILALPCTCPVGTEVIYSCPAFILLGKILEKIHGNPLNVLFREMVAEPLGMSRSSYLPDRSLPIVNAQLKEEDRGIVHDYNARHLGGVSGNAGLFSTLADADKFVQMLLRDGEPLFSREILDLAARNYTPNFSESRGLGFLYVDDRYPQTGGLFADGAIGHCGHTGQSFFLDRRTGLYVILLTDATVTVTRKFGRDTYSEVMKMRAAVHNAIKKDL